MKQTTRTSAVLLAVLVAAGGVVAIGVGGSSTPVQAQQEMTSVTLDDQTSEGNVVIVQSVNLSDGGYVVIHDASLEGGDTLGSVIGVSRYLEAGSHQRVPVTLARPLNATATIIAMPHLDTNDNQGFDFVMTDGEVDGPYTENDTAITDAGLLTVSEGTQPSTGLEFENQTLDGDTVTVESVTLYSGGFLVVHDQSLEEGDAVGSVIGASRYLEPGTHSDVEITLARPLNDTATLIAMPHYDTNSNQVFDFVTADGAVDDPYLENGSAATEEAVVTVESAEVTETPTTETPGTETPATETPATETPGTETPGTETPATETPATETPGTETPATETPATETPTTETPIPTGTPATETPTP